MLVFLIHFHTISEASCDRQPLRWLARIHTPWYSYPCVIFCPSVWTKFINFLLTKRIGRSDMSLLRSGSKTVTLVALENQQPHYEASLWRGLQGKGPRPANSHMRDLVNGIPPSSRASEETTASVKT